VPQIYKTRGFVHGRGPWNRRTQSGRGVYSFERDLEVQFGELGPAEMSLGLEESSEELLRRASHARDAQWRERPTVPDVRSLRDLRELLREDS